MRKKDLPLVFFTLLVQAAVGCFFTVAVLSRGIARNIESPIIRTLEHISMPIIVLLLATGLLIATSHLSKPTRAYRAISNLSSSWLSREMLFGLGFGAGTLSFAAASFLGGDPWIKDACAGAGAIAGLALVYCISKLYMLRTVPAWNTPATPMSFFGATLLLGSVITGLGLVLIHFAFGQSSQKHLPLASLLESLGILSMALVGIQVLAARLTLAYSKKTRGFPSLAPLRKTLTSRIAASSIGCITFWSSSIGLFGNIENSVIAVITLTLGTLLLIAGELVGRFLFFGMFKRVGL